MRILVTGGAGFIGSSLCERLLSRGNEVVCVDNLITGSRDNIAHLIPESGFEFIEMKTRIVILLNITRSGKSWRKHQLNHWP